MFLSAKYSPIGVDLGRTTKLVQFRLKGTPPRPEATFTATLNAAVPNNGENAEDRAEFVKDLRKALAAGKFGTRQAVVALPPSDVLLRPMTLPADEHDVAKKVRWEAESYLDYPTDEAVIDHVVLGEAKTAGERRLEVIAASAHKPKVLNALDLLARAGLTTIAVDIIPLALCRLIARTQQVGDEAVAAAIDIGAHGTNAVIMSNDELRMARPIAVGGDALTEAIQAALEISADEADILKCQHGIGAAATPGAGPAAQEEPNKIAHIVHDILRDKLDTLASELQRLFRYFAAQNQGRTVSHVALFGGGGALKRLDQLLTERLQTQAQAGAPLSAIVGEPVELKKGHEGSFAVAAGLALRDS